MREINYKNDDGKTINVSVMGYFRIAELEKEFIMYSQVDDDSCNDTGHILIGKVIKENDYDYKIVGVKSNEKDMVLAYYNEISEQVGGSKDE